MTTTARDRRARARVTVSQCGRDIVALAEIFEQPLPQPADGVIAMPTAPGLGLTLDRRKLERFRVA